MLQFQSTSTLRDMKVEVEGREFSPADVVQGLKLPDLAVKTLAARAACLMRDRVLVDAGVIPLLVEALGHKGSTDLQLEAANCLGNICYHHPGAVADAGGIPALCAVLRALAPDDRGAGSAVGTQAVRALKFIVREGGAASRDAVLSAGALWAMLPHMRPDTSLPLLRETVHAYSFMCRSCVQPPAEVVQLSPALPYIADLLLNTQDDSVLGDACWALFKLTGGYPPSPSPAHTEAVASTPGLLARLSQLLLRPDYPRKGTPLWVFDNLLGGTDSQRQRCLDAGCLAPICACLSRSDVEKYRQRAAVQAITSLAGAGSPPQLAPLLAPACLRPYTALLAADDSATVELVLDGMTSLLQAAAKDGKVDEVCFQLQEMGAVGHMQQLQYHANDEVYRKNLHLIEEYFGVEPEGASE